MPCGRSKKISKKNKYCKGKKMEEEQNIREEMNKLSSEFPKKTSHVIPEGYFESFPDRVLNQWKREASKPLYKKRQWKATITIAASVAVLLIGGWLIFSKPA